MRMTTMIARRAVAGAMPDGVEVAREWGRGRRRNNRCKNLRCMPELRGRAEAARGVGGEEAG